MSRYKIGHLIAASTPLVHVTMDAKKKEYCDFCMMPNDHLKQCIKCQRVFYCDTTCQREDWRHHKLECRIYADSYQDITQTLDRLLLRLVLILNQKPELKTAGGMKPGQFYPNVTRCYNDLITNEMKIRQDSARWNHFVRLADIFTKLEIPFERLDLLEHFCRLVVNSFSILNTDLNEIGVGLYVLESVFDHSCIPNAAPAFDGIDLEIRAIKDINRDEKITINYIDLKLPRYARQVKLDEQYYFVCECPKCFYESDREIKYEDLDAMILQMDNCITDEKYGEAMELCKKTIPMMHEIYGDYHPDLTIQLVRLYKLSCLLCVNEPEHRQLAQKTEQAINITHGANHRIYRLFMELQS